ncbi:hypothetical protein D1B31_21025 [Neobacillus notoginsengisoli]|uniref:Uncharacterized protein n=1 Tax=Neobacillus notoginsengisoli TaxID=1578198 RepID=A0A417YIK3_9BACI|nr:hypothetical protein D1B31_21025 [Neobacillus notoginsengisoli]
MIGAEGTKTPAGCGGKVETPQAPRRRGGSTDAPRKAKCLERKSTKLHHEKKISSSTYIIEVYFIPAVWSFVVIKYLFNTM